MSAAIVGPTPKVLSAMAASKSFFMEYLLLSCALQSHNALASENGVAGAQQRLDKEVLLKPLPRRRRFDPSSSPSASLQTKRSAGSSTRQKALRSGALSN